MGNSTTINNYFDKVFCINLDRRPDKWAECQNEFNKHSIDVERISAIDGDTIEYSGLLKKGVIGCALSHKYIIELAIQRNYNSILILEDDVVFEENANELFANCIKYCPDNWDMLYFGGNHNSVELDRVNEWFIKCTKTRTTHAYALKSNMFHNIIARLSKAIDKDVDVIYTEFQKTNNAYCFSPRIAWQRAGHSDIFNFYVDYQFLNIKDGKHDYEPKE